MKIASIVSGMVMTLGVAAVTGCAHPQMREVVGDDPIASTSARVPAHAANKSAVSMSADLRKVCGIEDKGEAPKFDFDSALLSPTDRSELDQLSKCMTSGPLSGKNIQLVGRSDPRGEAEYNMNLGATRANAVEYYLGQLGISVARLTTTSRGALDAEGHDEASWAVDRRVDLRLAGQ